MKILFKITTISVLMLFAAQNSFAQVAIGVKAGVNAAYILFSDESEEGAKTLLSFNGGLTLEAPISEKFGLRTGLELQGKGVKLEYSDTLFNGKAKTNPIYLQIPIVFAYNGSKFFVGAGPYVGAGIAGKYNTKVTVLGIDVEDSGGIKFGSKMDDSYSAIDFGLRFDVGLKLDKIRVSLNYDLGLTDLTPKDGRVDGGETARHGVIGISVGYMIK